MDLSSGWLQGKGPLPPRLLLFIFSGFAWSLWTTTNKMAIEKKFPHSPSEVIYLAISYLQKWSILLKEGDRRCVEQVEKKILAWLKNFTPTSLISTDVIEFN